MFNVMKADFLTARLLAYRALYGETPDSGTYADTLDYAQYGTSQSLLTIAQRTCIDVLDKIALATSEYFELAGRFIYFSNRWYGDKLKGGWSSVEPGFTRSYSQTEHRSGRPCGNISRHRIGRGTPLEQAPEACVHAPLHCHTRRRELRQPDVIVRRSLSFG